ncbi:hypothetical protein MZO42_05895 [Sphingomonas psychrotolerans]|uniref:DUF6894 domain-containing protein n=1 Tax=Sphingomonas psychrotolerans TaxID=1327635 RepID=A0ABU3N164_9SPHN|nr:hypothetical protein [Sphingomonas psychrotolerans]MDT8758223.1 hypothetical protein [Sphingomonas psychrotolerans]
MPRFFLHLFDGEITLDSEGVELTSAEDAILIASQSAVTMAGVAVSETARLDRDHYVAVADDTGGELARVYFGEVVTVVGGKPSPDQDGNLN